MHPDTVVMFILSFPSAVPWTGTLHPDTGSPRLPVAPCLCSRACSLAACWLVPFPAICSCLIRLLATASHGPSCFMQTPDRGRQTHSHVHKHNRRTGLHPHVDTLTGIEIYTHSRIQSVAHVCVYM